MKEPCLERILACSKMLKIDILMYQSAQAFHGIGEGGKPDTSWIQNILLPRPVENKPYYHLSELNLTK